MSRNAKIVLGLLAVLVGALGVLFYLASASQAKQTESAVATVVRAEREEKRGDDDTIVTLAYRAGETMVQGRARVSGLHMEDYPAGRQLRICYDPASPESLRIDDGPCS